MVMSLRLLLCLAALATACDDGVGSGNPPVAALDAPEWVVIGAEGRLDGSRTEDPDGDIVHYRFTIADGTATKVVTEPIIDHVFRIGGWIEVTLVVVDSRGHESRDSAVVSVR